MKQSLYKEMKECAVSNGGKTAIDFYGKKYTFLDILYMANKLAYSLKSLGVKPKDIVTFCLPNTPSAVIAFYAVNKLGAIVNLIHPFSPFYQLKDNLKVTNSKLLIVYDQFLAQNADKIESLGDIKLIESKSEEFMGLEGKIYYKFSTRKVNWYKGKKLSFRSLIKDKSDTDKFYEFEENDTAVMLPSGGTTGSPKIIMHNCRVFNDLAGHIKYFVRDDISTYSSMYSVLPIFHGFGLCMNMHLCMTQGITNVMCIKFDPERMAKAIEKHKIAVITGVPTMFSRLLKCKKFLEADLSSIKECFVGGDMASQGLLNEFNALLKEKGSRGRLFAGYGLTETVTVCAVTNFRHNKPNSVGYPLPGTDIIIVKDNVKQEPGEIGEICIKTPIMMLGYYKSSFTPLKEFMGEKWLFTGDYGYIDEDGFLYFKQRVKNIIKVNGVPVYPSEIEEIMENVEGVARVAAMGVKDESKGQVVKLYIELLPNAQEGNVKNAINDIAKEKLITYARPKYIEIRNRLPLNAIGKIDRKALEEEK